MFYNIQKILFVLSTNVISLLSLYKRPEGKVCVFLVLKIWLLKVCGMTSL